MNEATPLAHETRALLDVVLIVAGLVFFALGNRVFKHLWKLRGIPIIGGVALSAGATGLLILSFGVAWTSPALSAALTLLLAVGLIFISFSWFVTLRFFSLRTASIIAFASFALSLLAGGFDLSAGEFGKLLPVALLPLASGVLCFLQLRQAFGRQLYSSEPLQQGHPNANLLIAAFALFMAEGFACAIVRAVWTHGGVGYSVAISAVTSYTFTLLLALLCLAIAYRTQHMHLRLFGVALTLLFTTAVGVFALVYGRSAAGASMITSTMTTVYVVAPLYFLDAAARGKFSLQRSYCISLVLDAAFAFVAYTVVPWLNSSGKLSGGMFDRSAAITVEQMMPFAFTAAFVLVLVCGACFALVLYTQARTNDHDSTSPASDGQKRALIHAPSINEPDVVARSANVSFDEAITMLAREHELTERETEIAACLARGYTAKRAAEELCLALNTVQSYTKIIYRKLDIHSKQQLIDILADLRRS